MKLPENVKYIINKLRAAGHRADIVGGCVRDFLRGVLPSDYDITTDATPEEMEEVFRDERVIKTGIKHGTLTVIIGGEPYEVTTYRVDGNYTDNRHPDSVTFTKELSGDLSRRDFTVNAIAYNDIDGYTDVFGGLRDIENKIIRAVGDPVVRFSEDALRILRALRFSATLGFKIEEETAKAIHTEKGRLKNVSAERVFTEWKKLIGGIYAYELISEYPDVIGDILGIEGEIKLPKKEDFLSADANIREMSIFAMNSGEAAKERFLSSMARLKADNKRRDFGEDVLENLGTRCENFLGITLLLIKSSPEVAEGVISLSELVTGKKTKAKEILQNLLQNGVCYRIGQLKIDGNDLKSLGISGRKIGEILNRLLLDIAYGKVKNEREALIKFVTESV